MHMRAHEEARVPSPLRLVKSFAVSVCLKCAFSRDEVDA